MFLLRFPKDEVALSDYLLQRSTPLLCFYYSLRLGMGTRVFAKLWRKMTLERFSSSNRLLCSHPMSNCDLFGSQQTANCRSLTKLTCISFPTQNPLSVHRCLAPLKPEDQWNGVEAFVFFEAEIP